MHRQKSFRRGHAELVVEVTNSACLSDAIARWRLDHTVEVYSTACSASAHAIGQGMQLVREGALDVAAVGGFDPLSAITQSGFGLLRALTAGTCRPFDKKRNGIMIGEGSAFLILETREAAEKRGVEPLAIMSALAEGHARGEFRRLPPTTQIVVSASDEAFKAAGVDPKTLDAERAGVFIGTDQSILRFAERYYRDLLDKGPRAPSPLLFQDMIFNAAAGTLCLRYNFKGPSIALTSGNAAGLQTIEVASRFMAAGKIDFALVVGMDELAPVNFLARRCPLQRRQTPPKAAARSTRATTGSSAAPRPALPGGRRDELVAETGLCFLQSR